MTKRIFNFSAGPAVLPEPVLKRAQEDLFSLPGVGASILEISHRSKEFEAILAKTEADLRALLAIPNNYKVLFLQGGSRLQFSMVPMNLLTEVQPSADYVLTGSWGKYAIAEAQKLGTMNIPYDSKGTNYDRLPEKGTLQLSKNAAYVHTTSNETIQGVQFLYDLPTGDAPLVCDMSSDFLCRPVDVSKYGLIYACAQKNAGPAGVTIAIIREDLLERSKSSLPGMLNYMNYAKESSMYNTPPTFAIYIVGLVIDWLRDEIGGLDKMLERNKAKAKLLYDEIDTSAGFYTGHAQKADRSIMNVTFRLPNETLEKSFLEGASKRDLKSLGGHRSVGGVRASIYNAMPVAGVEALRDYMIEFRARSI